MYSVTFGLVPSFLTTSAISCFLNLFPGHLGVMGGHSHVHFDLHNPGIELGPLVSQADRDNVNGSDQLLE